MLRRLSAQCLLIGALCFIPEIGHCQYFNNRYDFDSTTDFGRSITLLNDGSYFVTAAYSGPTNNWIAGLSTHISADGTTVTNTKKYSVTGKNAYLAGYGKIAVTNTNQYLLPLVVITKQYVDERAGILKLNNNGDSIFSRLYTKTPDSLERIYDVSFSSRSNSYLMVGSTTDTPYFGRVNGLLLITDTNGNLIRRLVLEKKAALPPEPLNGILCQFNSVEALPNGNILIGGTNGIVDSYLLGGWFDYYHYQPWFIIADSLGNIIRDTLYGPQYVGDGNIYSDKLGGYLHWGRLNKFITNNALNEENLPGYVAHLDTNFKVVWLHDFSSLTSHTNAIKVKQLANGDYLVMGVKTGHERGALVTRLSPSSGSTKWERLFTVDPRYLPYLVDAAERPDGSLVLVGMSPKDSTLPAYRGQDMWMLSIDSNGCDIPGCSLAVLPQPQASLSPLSVYPNPTQGKLTVKSESEGTLTVYGLQGNAVGTYNISRGTTTLELAPTIAAGIYFGRFTSKDYNIRESIRIVYQP